MALLNLQTIQAFVSNVRCTEEWLNPMSQPRSGPPLRPLLPPLPSGGEWLRPHEQFALCVSTIPPTHIGVFISDAHDSGTTAIRAAKRKMLAAGEDWYVQPITWCESQTDGLQCVGTTICVFLDFFFKN